MRMSPLKSNFGVDEEAEHIDIVHCVKNSPLTGLDEINVDEMMERLGKDDSNIFDDLSSLRKPYG